MSRHSPAEIIPYTRFIDAHRRWHAPVTVPSTPEPSVSDPLVGPEPPDAAVDAAADDATAVAARSNILLDSCW
jgi:hypothetical protein